MSEMGYEIKGKFFPSRRYISDGNAIHDVFINESLIENVSVVDEFQYCDIPYYDYKIMHIRRLNEEYDNFITQICEYLGCKKKMVIN